MTVLTHVSVYVLNSSYSNMTSDTICARLMPALGFFLSTPVVAQTAGGIDGIINTAVQPLTTLVSNVVFFTVPLSVRTCRWSCSG